MMHGQAGIGRLARALAAVEAFKDLSVEERGELAAKLELISIARGDLLIRQGELREALYLVVSGRFHVYVDGRAEPVAEIGPGRPIGEIAFFSGGSRTASVRAERDSLALKLDRGDFEALAARSPGIWRTITATLALRLADATAVRSGRERTRPRTVAVCRAGGDPIPPAFIDDLRAVFEARWRCAFLDSSAFKAAFARDVALESAEATSWFNELEGSYDYVFYLADPELSPWSEKSIRQADLVLAVGWHKAAPDGVSVEPNALERFADALHASANLRLVLLRDSGGKW